MSELKEDLVSHVMSRTKDDLTLLVVGATLDIQHTFGLTNEQGEMIVLRLTDLVIEISDCTLDMCIELMKEHKR